MSDAWSDVVTLGHPVATQVEFSVNSSVLDIAMTSMDLEGQVGLEVPLAEAKEALEKVLAEVNRRLGEVRDER